MDRKELERVVQRGECPTLEFKTSTAALREALETICAFLNTEGGTVLIGVASKGEILGQQVSDQTIHEIAQGLERLEPPAYPAIERIPVRKGSEVLVLRTQPNHESAPFTFEGRPYVRVGNTTRRMSQERYEELLLARAHARRRWENQPAVDVRLDDLDREEILRTREEAVRNRRISAATPMDSGDVLDRLGLRRNGIILQAAQVLYGTRFLPDYPQCLLKLARFRGVTVTGEIIDNRQEHMNAFAMVREAMSFLERNLPLSAHFTEGKIFRRDRFPIPPDALREIILNAVMHRDYMDPSGYVAVAVFDDRVEIRSIGRLPSGITVESLSGPHLSRPRNPLIADAFHRTGAVEIWGRGTNRVIEECRRYGTQPPIFKEEALGLVVTFKAPIGIAPPLKGRGFEKEEPSRDQVGTKLGLSEDQVQILPSLLKEQALTVLMALLGRTHRTKFRDQVLNPLIHEGLVEMTIPDKPRSSKQKYRLTAKGRELVQSLRVQGSKSGD